MGLKSPNIAAFLLPLLLILFTLSSQLEVVESTGRKLVLNFNMAAWEFSGTPIVYTPPSRSCGTSPAVFNSKWRRPRPCRLPPGSYIPASDQSP